jgi:uroporphyrinogen decarboxylase
MTSRERIAATLNHVEPDRVAIDLGATNATGISAIVYNKLKGILGIKGGEIRVTDIIQQPTWRFRCLTPLVVTR